MTKCWFLTASVARGTPCLATQETVKQAGVRDWEPLALHCELWDPQGRFPGTRDPGLEMIIWISRYMRYPSGVENLVVRRCVSAVDVGLFVEGKVEKSGRQSTATKREELDRNGITTQKHRQR